MSLRLILGLNLGFIVWVVKILKKERCLLVVSTESRARENGWYEVVLKMVSWKVGKNSSLWDRVRSNVKIPGWMDCCYGVVEHVARGRSKQFTLHFVFVRPDSNDHRVYFLPGSVSGDLTPYLIPCNFAKRASASIYHVKSQKYGDGMESRTARMRQSLPEVYLVKGGVCESTERIWGSV